MNLRWSFVPSATFLCCVLYFSCPTQGAGLPRNLFINNEMAPAENMDSSRVRDNFGAALTDTPSLTEKPHPNDLSNSADNDALWTGQTYFPSARSSLNSPDYSDWMAQNQQGTNDMWSNGNAENEDYTANYNPWGSQLHTYYKTHHKRGEDTSLRLRFGRSGVRLRYGRSGPPTLRFG